MIDKPVPVKELKCYPQALQQQEGKALYFIPYTAKMLFYHK
jgi:hypothetical protein